MNGCMGACMQVLQRDTIAAIGTSLKAYEKSLNEDDGWQKHGPPERVAKVLFEMDSLARTKSMIESGNSLSVVFHDAPQQAYYKQSMEHCRELMEKQNQEKQKILAELRAQFEATKADLGAARLVAPFDQAAAAPPALNLAPVGGGLL